MTQALMMRPYWADSSELGVFPNSQKFMMDKLEVFCHRSYYVYSIFSFEITSVNTFFKSWIPYHFVVSDENGTMVSKIKRIDRAVSRKASNDVSPKYFNGRKKIQMETCARTVFLFIRKKTCQNTSSKNMFVII